MIDTARGPGTMLRRASAGIIEIPFLGATFAYLVIPIAITALIAFNSAPWIEFPPSGLSLRWFVNLAESESWQAAALNTLIVGAICAVVATVVGTITAYGLSRIVSRSSRDIMFTLFVLPIVVPYAALAMALYPLYAYLHLLGTHVGVALAQSIVALPYVVIVVTASMRRSDRQLESAARTLGANRVKAFWFVVLPLLKPGVAAGAVLAFMTSFDDVIMPIFFGGSNTTTVAKAVFDALYNTSDPTVMAASTAVSGVGLTLLIAVLAIRRAQARGSHAN